MHGVNSAGGFEKRLFRHAQGLPFLFDIIGNRGKTTIPDRQAPKYPCPLGAHEFLSLTIVSRTGRLNNDWTAKKVADKASRDRLPQGLMCVNDVKLAPIRYQGTCQPPDITDPEQRPLGRGSNHTLDQDSATAFMLHVKLLRGHVPERPCVNRYLIPTPA